MINIGKWIPSALSALLIWRVALAVALIACLTVTGMLWFSGGPETDEAREDGRRFVITLATGEIDGKMMQAKTDPASKPEENTPDTKPEDPAPDSAETPPAEAGTPSETPPEEPVTPEPAQEPEPVEEPAPEVPEAATTEPEAEPEAESMPEPDISLPETSAPPESEDGAVAPTPLTYDQLPAPMTTPESQSSAPLVLPPTAPAPPLAGGVLPEIKPSSKKPPELNSLLTEKTDEGTVPKIAADGTRAWKFYSKPYASSSRKPMVAIVITGLGHNTRVTQHAIALPENITLTFSPYAKQLAQWEKSARLAGHEAMLELPMQPVDYPATDPGPFGLMLNVGTEENTKRLRTLMARMPTSVGFVSPRNEALSSSRDDFKLLLQSLGNRGLMLMVSKPPASDDIRGLLNESSTPNVIADFPIDEELSSSLIRARLVELEKLAQDKGYAVGIASPYPLTIAELRAWIAQLESKGVVLVPLSAIAKLDYS